VKLIHLELKAGRFEGLQQAVRTRILRDLYRGINGFKKDFQPITIVVKM